MAKALVVQAGGLGTVTKAMEGFGGFAKEYEQIEKVSAHHDNFWEVLLYGQIGRDRAVMFDLAEKLEFTATSEDWRVLAFPLNGNAQDLMMGAPTELDESRLRELNISLPKTGE